MYWFIHHHQTLINHLMWTGFTHLVRCWPWHQDMKSKARDDLTTLISEEAAWQAHCGVWHGGMGVGWWHGMRNKRKSWKTKSGNLMRYGLVNYVLLWWFLLFIRKYDDFCCLWRFLLIMDWLLVLMMLMILVLDIVDRELIDLSVSTGLSRRLTTPRTTSSCQMQPMVMQCNVMSPFSTPKMPVSSPTILTYLMARILTVSA